MPALTVQDIRDDLNLKTVRPVLEWIRKGLLVAVDAGSGGGRPTWRIELDDYEAFKASRKTGQPARQKRGRKPTRKLKFKVY